MINNSVFARTDGIKISFSIEYVNGSKNVIFKENTDEIKDGDMEFVFKYPNWQDDLFIRDKAMEVQNGSVILNASLVRYKKFSRLLTNWNLTDEEGNILPMDDENFAKLDPYVLNLIMDKLDSYILT